MEKSDVYKKAMNDLRKALKKYGGYFDLEKRDISNNLITQFLIDELADRLDQVKEIQEAAIMAQLIMIWSDLDNLVTSLQDARREIAQTRYETSTFFTVPTLEGFDPTVLSFSDHEILKGIQNLKPKLTAFAENIEVGSYGDASRQVMDVMMDVAKIQEVWNERARKIQEYKRIPID